MRLSNKAYLFFCICFSWFFISPVVSQEICNNGVDDDNNGLIDINDPACICKRGLIIDDSFEDTLCCPSGISQMNCVYNWIQASDATADYYNMCGFSQFETLSKFPEPLIDGDGFIGILNGRESSDLYKEYIGSCLPTPLLQNQYYKITLYVGFGSIMPSTIRSSSEPIEFSVFGNQDCSYLPFEGFKCPTDSETPGWIELASKNIFGIDNWIEVEFEVLPSVDINAIVLGPSCLPSTGKYYYFIDKISIVESSKNIHLELIDGSPCEQEGTLSIEVISNATYQWYLNGVSLLGALDNELIVSIEGKYQVVIETDGACVFSYPFYYYDMGLPIADLGEDRQFCSPKDIVLGEQNLGLSYLWNTGETTAKIRVNESGYYAVTVTNSCGEAFSEIDISPCESCQMLLPNVFTPNNDGLNDVFKGYSDCPIEFYHLSVFSRWGEKVFETYDFFSSWEGLIKNKTAVSGVYIWSLEYTVELNGEQIDFLKNGDITLLR